MASRKYAIASFCLLIGCASLHIQHATSFTAPTPIALRTSSRYHTNSKSTCLGVRTQPRPSLTSTESDEDVVSAKAKRSNPMNMIDELWSNENMPMANGDELQTTNGSSNNGDLILDEDSSADSTKWILVGGTAMVLAAAGALAVNMGNDLGIDLDLGQLIKDPSTSFDTILKSLETMDVESGMLYFSSFYILAEILAIPAVPILTASSGYLFGTILGTATCLFSAAIAASISFVIGRTLLRGYVETVLEDNPKFQSMDKAIEKEGFKLMLLLRLSPLFPFALSNYLYGASSIKFLPYFFGTLFGFAPGTFAYVYAGRIGKALTMDSASSEPWYVYVGGMAVVVGLIKIAGDVASGVIDSMEEGEGAGGWDEGDMDI